MSDGYWYVWNVGPRQHGPTHGGSNVFPEAQITAIPRKSYPAVTVPRDTGFRPPVKHDIRPDVGVRTPVLRKYPVSHGSRFDQSSLAALQRERSRQRTEALRRQALERARKYGGRHVGSTSPSVRIPGSASASTVTGARLHHQLSGQASWSAGRQRMLQQAYTAARTVESVPSGRSDLSGPSVRQGPAVRTAPGRFGKPVTDTDAVVEQLGGELWGLLAERVTLEELKIEPVGNGLYQISVTTSVPQVVQRGSQGTFEVPVEQTVVVGAVDVVTGRVYSPGEQASRQGEIGPPGLVASLLNPVDAVTNVLSGGVALAATTLSRAGARAATTLGLGSTARRTGRKLVTRSTGGGSRVVPSGGWRTTGTKGSSTITMTGTTRGGRRAKGAAGGSERGPNRGVRPVKTASRLTGEELLTEAGRRLGARSGRFFWTRETMDDLTAKRAATESALAREEARIVKYRGDVDDATWNKVRAGQTKRLYNLMEDLHVIDLQTTFTHRKFYSQVEVVGIRTADGVERIPTGKGRIADWGSPGPDGFQLGDIKTESAITHSVKGGLKRSKDVEAEFGGKLRKQLDNERWVRARAHRLRAEADDPTVGRVLLRGKDPVTGARVEFEVGPDELLYSRVQAYGRTGSE